MLRRRSRLVAVLLVGVAALVLALAVAVPRLGAWLVVADPLERSDAIFVLDGRTPSREVEAVALYHRGLAPYIGLSLARDPQRVARRVARMPPPQEAARGILTTLGVPEGAILLMTKEVTNTEEELAAIAEMAHARGFRRVILVSSPSHTRRIRMMWDAGHERALPALVHPNGYDAFDGRRWWRARRSLEEVLHEVGAIVNFKLGSVIATSYGTP
jgi:uncharacterized SAM-binding protein YcdF (DUF218 family)